MAESALHRIVTIRFFGKIMLCLERPQTTFFGSGPADINPRRANQWPSRLGTHAVGPLSVPPSSWPGLSRPSMSLTQQERRACPAPVYAFGFAPAQKLGAPKLMSEGGKAGHDEPWVEDERHNWTSRIGSRRQAVLQCLSGSFAVRCISAAMTAASALVAALARIGSS